MPLNVDLSWRCYRIGVVDKVRWREEPGSSWNESTWPKMGRDLLLPMWRNQKRNKNYLWAYVETDSPSPFNHTMHQITSSYYVEAKSMEFVWNRNKDEWTIKLTWLTCTPRYNHSSSPFHHDLYAIHQWKLGVRGVIKTEVYVISYRYRYN